VAPGGAAPSPGRPAQGTIIFAKSNSGLTGSAQRHLAPEVRLQALGRSGAWDTSVL